MTTMLVTYKRPIDEAAFLDHYFKVHVPLARSLPGLRAYRVSRGPIDEVAGGEPPFLVAILTFDSRAALQAAFASDIGQACARDRRKLAPGDGSSTVLLFDDGDA